MLPFTHATLPDSYSTFFHTVVPGVGHGAAADGAKIAAEIERLSQGILSEDTLTAARRALDLTTPITVSTLPTSLELTPIYRAALKTANLSPPPAAVAPPSLRRFITQLPDASKRAVTEALNGIIQRTNAWIRTGLSGDGFRAFPNNVIYPILLAHVKPALETIDLSSLTYDQFMQRIISNVSADEKMLYASEVLEDLSTLPDNAGKIPFLRESQKELRDHLAAVNPVNLRRLDFGSAYLSGTFTSPRHDLLAMAVMKADLSLKDSIPEHLADLQRFIQTHPKRHEIEGCIYHLFHNIEMNNPSLLFYILADFQRRDLSAERKGELFRYLPRPLRLPPLPASTTPAPAPVLRGAVAAGGAGAPMPITLSASVASPALEEVRRIANNLTSSRWKEAAEAVKNSIDEMTFLDPAMDIKQMDRDYRFIRIMYILNQCIYQAIGKPQWEAFLNEMKRIPTLIPFASLSSKPGFETCGRPDGLLFLHGSPAAKMLRENHQNPNLMQLARAEFNCKIYQKGYRLGDGVYLTPHEAVAMHYAREVDDSSGLLRFLLSPPRLRSGSALVAYVESPYLLESYMAVIKSTCIAVFEACKNKNLLSRDMRPSRSSEADIEAPHIINTMITEAICRADRGVSGLAISQFEHKTRGWCAAFVSYTGTSPELPSDGALRLLGYRPYTGRGFGPEEDVTGRK